ncbi:hydrogenase maturation nickel metallochaperone HypA [Methylocystis sp. B8]|uniref:hydrogenase maturation nickel metallochaperone HypA/HybF n=1 Tax=Methylocystis sp. B8 TaxID=544938 RepID=UPI0010FF5A01|nr:hydrogenase maturation nickel metallochaperone HypA [Methylocystis sp. B8]TLG78774.1 hydrogenase maturation nickel metallochaperone HypA [Methylocystis sp. B8]
MHELSIVCSIVELASEAAEGRAVRRVTIEIGKLSGVEPEAVAFCFPEVARGTPLEDATLDIREVEAEARCDICGAEFPTPDMLSACPCGSRQFERLRGDELNIKSIEIEEAA